MFLQHIYPAREYADVIVPGDAKLESALAEIVPRIEALLRRRA